MTIKKNVIQKACESSICGVKQLGLSRDMRANKKNRVAKILMIRKWSQKEICSLGPKLWATEDRLFRMQREPVYNSMECMPGAIGRGKGSMKRVKKGNQNETTTGGPESQRILDYIIMRE